MAHFSEKQEKARIVCFATRLYVRLTSSEYID